MDSGFLLALMQSAPAAGGQVSGMINYSVSIGDILTASTTITAVVSAYARLISRIDVMDAKLAPLWDDFMRGIRRPRE